jgi:uncharacterized protein YbaP (TraB family)
MEPPYYILINNKDLNEIIYFHAKYYGRYYDKPNQTHISPRRMKHIETAIKFRDIVLNEYTDMNPNDVKIILVTKDMRHTKSQLKKGLIKEYTFSNVYCLEE